ncbi:NAD(P)-binding protein [Calocera cornea HHB12733]|uniref:NAD(P)-binding protein n=1 Tax=Calocera cornea HHB12733 TaxID=1353952 RepID=A0A165F055_9BASI|nr:NAD(P)-binding protein [Calocera cornea HHB12733]
MSGYKNFAVAGAGTIGLPIVEELLKAKAAGTVAKVVVLTRSATGKDALAEKGAEPIVVDYDSPTSLQSALKGIDIVISTLNVFGLDAQSQLADAAKAAGVKLFVPSEFGGDTVNFPEGFNAPKAAQRERLTAIGIPWALFPTGPFADWIWFVPYIGFDLVNGKFEVAGTGNSPVTFTSRKDIARYVVHVLTSLPPSKLENHVFKVEGQRISVKGVAEEYEKRTGKKIEITSVPLEVVKDQAAKNPGDFKSWFALYLELHGTVGKKEEVNVDWPELNPESVVDAILSYKS